MKKSSEQIYCLNFWRNRFHGKSGEEPYFDVLEDGVTAGKKMRVFVAAQRFQTWDDWKFEADKARACAYVGESATHGYFVKSGSSYPLCENPAFMIEKPEIPYLDIVFWINVMCSDSVAFHCALAQAKELAELKAKSLSPGEIYVPFHNAHRRHKATEETGLDAFLKKNGVAMPQTENCGVHDGEIYGPVPDDIKTLLQKAGLYASDDGDTLGELFQRWGVQ